MFGVASRCVTVYTASGRICNYNSLYIDLNLYNEKPLNRSLKIVCFYVLSALCLGLFLYMENSQDLREFLKKADRVRADWGFGFYVSVGIIKMVSLTVGVATPLILTAFLIKHKLQK